MNNTDMVFNAGMTLIYNLGKKEFNAYDVKNQIEKMYNVSLSRQDVAIELPNLFRLVKITPEYSIYTEY